MPAHVVDTRVGQWWFINCVPHSTKTRQCSDRRRTQRATHLQTDNDEKDVHSSDWYQTTCVVTTCPLRARALLLAPVTHTPPSAPRRRVPQWRTERFGKWRPFITAAYAHTPRPKFCRVRRQSESPLSMLMSHNYLLTAQTNGVRGGEVTSNQNCHRWSSPVIERERRLAACHTRLWGRWRLRGVCLPTPARVWLEMITDC